VPPVGRRDASQGRVVLLADGAYNLAMGEIFDRIRAAVRDDRFLVSWHADERCEQRQVAAWQVVAGLEDARLLSEREASEPHPSIIVREELVDGTEVEVVWAWMPESGRAILVTVYFPE